MKITENSYAFVENAHHQDEWHVKIKEGDYTGVIYKYGRLNFSEENEDGSANLQFDYYIEKVPEELGMTKEDLGEDTTFLNTLGDILVHIIEDAIEHEKFKLGNDDKPTDSESTVHE